MNKLSETHPMLCIKSTASTWKDKYYNKCI